MWEAARQPSGPPAQRDPVVLEHGDDVGVGVEGVEEHDRVGLVPVRAVADGDAVRMQGERDQVGVDAEMARRSASPTTVHRRTGGAAPCESSSTPWPPADRGGPTTSMP